jgi:hypothetical protein
MLFVRAFRVLRTSAPNASFRPSFPTSGWGRNCLRNSVSQRRQQSCGDKCGPKQSLGTRIRSLVATALFLALSATASAADETAQENHFISNARQLVFEGKRSGEGYFSPDGKKLIFQSEREPENPFYQQYILDL